MNGRIKSFNFDQTTGRQLSNQDYSICIRNERNFCSILYTGENFEEFFFLQWNLETIFQISACPDSTGTNRTRSFSLSGNSNSQVNAMVIYCSLFIEIKFIKLISFRSEEALKVILIHVQMTG